MNLGYCNLANIFGNDANIRIQACRDVLSHCGLCGCSFHLHRSPTVARHYDRPLNSLQPLSTTSRHVTPKDQNPKPHSPNTILFLEPNLKLLQIVSRLTLFMVTVLLPPIIHNRKLLLSFRA
jgi:hypothetical protein